MNEPDYSRLLAMTRDLILEYLYRHNPALFEVYYPETSAFPEQVPEMVKALLAELEPEPVNDPAQYKRGLFE